MLSKRAELWELIIVEHAKSLFYNLVSVSIWRNCGWIIIRLSFILIVTIMGWLLSFKGLLLSCCISKFHFRLISIDISSRRWIVWRWLDFLILYRVLSSVIKFTSIVIWLNMQRILNRVLLTYIHIISASSNNIIFKAGRLVFWNHLSSRKISIKVRFFWSAFIINGMLIFSFESSERFFYLKTVALLLLRK
jgi:hypothetical protein